MDLPDLESSDYLLGLDLVAGWQLDKVKEQSLWSSWRFMQYTDLLERTGAPGVIPGSAQGLSEMSLGRLPLKCNRLYNIHRLTGEIELEVDAFLLLTWAREMDQVEIPSLGELYSSRHYAEIPCPSSCLGRVSWKTGCIVCKLTDELICKI